MSKEAVRLFVDKIEQDEELQAIVQDWHENPNTTTNLAEVGREHGFEFTEEEGHEVWDEIQNGEELSDFALELIAGGVPVSSESGTSDVQT